MERQTFTDTGRTAIFADGHSERIYETFVPDGIFAGATYEVTESERMERAPMIFALPPESTDEIVARIARDWS